MIFDLSGKEKSTLLGAAEIALGLMGEGEEARGWQRPEDRPLSAEETADHAMGDPFMEHGLVAAGKKLCGTCDNKMPAKGVWKCRLFEYDGTEPFYPCPVPDPAAGCPGFSKKLSSPRPPQPKKKGMPAPEGAKFIYIGAPRGKTKKGVPQHRGVVTVAWIETIPGLLRMALSFCAPTDPWCKATGRDMAITRLCEHPVVIPYLYSPKRTVHEVVRAVLTHEFWRIAALAPGVTMFGTVPSWTRGLGKRMEEKERMLGGGIRRLKVPSLPDFLGGIYIAPPTRDLPFNILARMMADIAKLGND